MNSENDLFNKRCSLNRSHWTYTTTREYSIVTEYDLVCDKTALAALTTASFFAGMVIGAVGIGPISDIYGRRLVLIICAAIVPFPCILSYFITAIWQQWVLNMIRGAGIVGYAYVSFVYLQEFAPPNYRSTSSNIFMLFCTISFVLVDGFAYLVRKWRMLSLYLGVVWIPFLMLFYYLEESPRWLLSNGRKEEAEIVLGKMIQYKGNVKPFIQVANNSTDVRRYTYIDLIRNVQVLKLCLRLIFIWSILPVLYYSIAVQSMNYGGNMYVDFALSTIADLPAFFLSTLLSDRIGRRKTNFIGLFSTSLIIGSIPLVPRSLYCRHNIVMALTIAAKIACDLAFYGIYIWTSELFPTVLRSQGFMICATVEKLGMISVPFVVTILKQVNYNLPFILMSISGVLASIIGLWLPETNKMPTRESYQDFFSTPSDNNDKDVGIDNHVVVVTDEYV